MDRKKLVILLVILATFLTAAGQLLLKQASQKIEWDFIALITNYSLIAGIIVYAFSLGLLFLSLKFGELSVVYPLMALSFIWVTLISIIYFKELVTTTNMVGIGLIFVGGMLIGGKYARN